MKVKVKVPEYYEEKEIELPFYSKSGNTVYVVLGEKQFIACTVFSDNSAIINHMENLTPGHDQVNGTPITAEEFWEKYDKALTTFEKLKTF